MPDNPRELESAKERPQWALDEAYRIICEYPWGWEENASDELTHDQEQHQLDLADELVKVLDSRQAGEIARLKGELAEARDSQEVLIRFGRAVINAGPPDDHDPPSEILDEYYAASDAAVKLATKLARENSMNKPQCPKCGCQLGLGPCMDCCAYGARAVLFQEKAAGDSCLTNNPLEDPAEYGWQILECGHHRSLLESSIESDYKFCQLCETRSRLNDALTMERELKQRAESAESQLSAAQAERDELRKIAVLVADATIAGGRAFDETKLYEAWRLVVKLGIQRSEP